MKPFFLFLFLIAFLPGHSQLFVSREGWLDSVAALQPDPAMAKEPAVILLDRRRIEFFDISSEQVLERYGFHRLVRVQDDRGIESFNKIYIPSAARSLVLEIRARTILPGGKVILLDSSNIKEIQQEDGSIRKIFAMEGLVKGAVIEYFYTLQQDPNFFGNEPTQHSIPILRNLIEIRSPDRLRFEPKAYNCTFNWRTDSLPGGLKEMTGETGPIMGADDEKYAAYRMGMGHLEYKLSYNQNKGRGTERLYTWNDLAKRIFTRFSVSSDKEIKWINQLVDKNRWEDLPFEIDKIRAVENWIKDNILYREDVPELSFDQMAKRRLAGSEILRMYDAVFTRLGIDFQIVLTADRENASIDKNFENWNNCDNYLFYFPASRDFLAPTRNGFRYPWVVPQWADGNGVFCKQVRLGNYISAIAEIKPVPLRSYRNTFNNLNAEVSFTPQADSVRADLRLLFAGYSAAYFRESVANASPDDMKSYFKSIMKGSTNSENVQSSQIENNNPNDGDSSKPFTVHLTGSSADLVENAGGKLLFHVGQLIGTQTEMYQEKTRHFPIYIGYPHYEQRIITCHLPAGYRVKNPEELNIREQFPASGEQQMGFVSGYQLNGNDLKITVVEDYRRTDFPLTDYPSFIKIINASADFNKIVLILEKI